MDAGIEKKAGRTTQVISLRLSNPECERLNARAAALGMSRNAFVRLCLHEEAPRQVPVEASQIGEVINALRQAERTMESHVDQLEGALRLAEQQGWSREASSWLEASLSYGERLMEELFRAQGRAVRLLDSLRGGS